MDGRFVPRFGLYPEFVREIRQLTSLPIDIHMMVEEPVHQVQAFSEAGASRVVFHLESSRHPHRTVEVIREFGLEAGLALNPHVSPVSLEYLLPQIKVVTVMGINPGIVGHKLIHATFSKLIELRKYLDDHSFGGVVEIDGGVTFENLVELWDSGANIAVVGAGSVFQDKRSTAANLAIMNELRGGSGVAT